MYSTMLHGAGVGTAPHAVALDTAGNAYVTGGTSHSGIPVTPDAFQPYAHGTESQAFLTKFNSTGSGLTYSTYLGGTGSDSVGGVAVDQVGDAYVSGTTQSLNFPVTPFAFQPVSGGGDHRPPCDDGYTCDAFVTKFPLGAPTALSITGITPTSGGNAGTITPAIYGTGFHNGATAQLNCGSVVGQNSTVSAGGQLMNTTLDLTSTSPGTCDVVVTNPDGTSAMLSNGFTVQQGGAPDIRVRQFTDGTRIGSNATYFVTLSNVGNVDGPPLLGAEDIQPWFTYLSSSRSPSAILQSDSIWPTNPGVGKYDAQVRWSFPTSPVGSQFFTFTAKLDRQVPAGAQVEGRVCVDEQSVAVGTCYTADVICDAGLTVLCAELTGPFLFTCESGALAACHFGLDGCLKDASRIHGQLCWGSDTPAVGSRDPNQIAGSPGIGASGWVAGNQLLSYILEFQNDPNATAPAQRVVATNPLNAAALNIQTLRFAPLLVADHQVPIPATFAPQVNQDQFDTNLDLRPAKNLLVQIHSSVDSNTGIITWIFQSIDPITGMPPSDPTVGFLGPGESVSLFFGVYPRFGISTGTVIMDRGTVVFDDNAPMSTPPWTNTLDNNAPTSRVLGLASSQSCSNFKVQWSGSDIGAGTKGYAVYSSDNGGAFAPWLTNTTLTSLTFASQVGHTYGFYSIATDLVGNVEPAKTSAEATTIVKSSTSCGPPSLSGAVSVVSYINNTLSLNLQVTDIGTSDALNTLIKTMTFRTLGGAGTVTLANPTLPIIMGTVSVGNTITTPLTLNVPSTVTKFSMTEGGTMRDGQGKTYSFSIGENVVPK